VTAALASERIVATSAVAYAELRSTFARRLRERYLDEPSHRAAVTLLAARWAGYVTLAIDDACLRQAGELVDRHTRHALRALDAIHLASALRIAGADPSGVTFACWDLRLWRAARDEGFTMLPASEPV